MRRIRLFFPAQRRRRHATTAAVARAAGAKVKEYALRSSGCNCLARSSFPATKKVVMTDTPKTAGGTNAGAQPVEHLLAALVGCKQATSHFVARKLWPRHLKLERIDFDLTAWRDERGALEMPITCTPQHPSRVQQVSGTAVVHAPGCSYEDIRQLAEQVEQRCPVANLFVAAGTRMDIKWVLAGDGRPADDV